MTHWKGRSGLPDPVVGAAAGSHGLHDNNNVSKPQYYTMQLYKELEVETRQGCGIFQPGAIYLALTRNREHQPRIQAAKARGMRSLWKPATMIAVPTR